MAAIKPFKPLDEKFPFDRQLGIAAAPLVLINLFTVRRSRRRSGLPERFQGGCRDHNESTGLHCHATTSSDRRQPDLPELRGVGIHRGGPCRLH